MALPRALLGLGAAVVAALVAVVCVLTVLRAGPADPAPSPSAASSATLAAQRFWTLAAHRHCAEASRMVWAPIARGQHQADFRQRCRQLVPAGHGASFGEARADPTRAVPYGASDLVAVPVTVHRHGAAGHDQLLGMVLVDGRWLVSL